MSSSHNSSDLATDSSLEASSKINSISSFSKSLIDMILSSLKIILHSLVFLLIY
ncbi:MAG: hypothetical protein MJ232_05880 [archaeon]|nr:hypothetical protein [archaeon]